MILLRMRRRKIFADSFELLYPINPRYLKEIKLIHVKKLNKPEQKNKNGIFLWLIFVVCFAVGCRKNNQQLEKEMKDNGMQNVKDLLRSTLVAPGLSYLLYLHLAPHLVLLLLICPCPFTISNKLYIFLPECIFSHRRRSPVLIVDIYFYRFLLISIFHSSSRMDIREGTQIIKIMTKKERSF